MKNKINFIFNKQIFLFVLIQCFCYSSLFCGVHNYRITKTAQLVSAIDEADGQTVYSGTDAATVIQSCLNTMTGGGRIFLGSGTYLLTSGLTIEYNHVTLEGSGYFSTVLKLGDNVNQDVIEGAKSTGSIWYLLLRNLKIDGNRDNNNQGCGVSGYMWRSLIENVLICNVAEDGIYTTNNTVGLKIIQCLVENAGRYGLCIGTTDSWIEKCTISGCDEAGIQIYGSPTKIFQCHLWGNNIGILYTTSKSRGFSWICKCFFDKNLKEGIRMGTWAVYSSLIKGNYFLNNSQEQFNTWDDISSEIQKLPYVMREVNINGNTFSGTTSRYNIFLGTTSSNNLISGNIFQSATAPHVKNLGIDNHITGNKFCSTKNAGTATIEAGQTDQIVNHGLAFTPGNIHLTPTKDTAGKRYWINSKDPETFTIRISSVYTSDISFDWVALGKTNQNPVTIIVDNDSNNVATSGYWTTSALNSQRYGLNYFHEGNTGTSLQKYFSWQPILPETSSYNVFMWWSSASYMAENAFVVIKHQSIRETKVVNQRENGGQWVYIGTYVFDKTTASDPMNAVYIKNYHDDGTTANGYVIADAVKFVKED